MTILEGSGIKGHQSAKKDPLDYHELSRDRHVRAFNLVREGQIRAKHQAANGEIDKIVHNKSRFVIGDWAWVYDYHSTSQEEQKNV